MTMLEMANPGHDNTDSAGHKELRDNTLAPNITRCNHIQIQPSAVIEMTWYLMMVSPSWNLFAVYLKSLLMTPLVDIL